MMRFASPEALRTDGAKLLRKGPILMILCDDEVELDSTIDHHLALGFAALVVAVPQGITAPAHDDPRVHILDMPRRDASFTVTAVNALIAAVPAGTWIGYLYNAEYLYTPFSETRTVGEALTFCSEERRDSMLTYVVDLYSAHLHGNGVDRDWANIDKSGYYALARWDADGPKDRQLDFYGGLRWRFEEHVPWERRRIDRVGLFRALEGVQLLADHRLNIEELNTYACPWHHSPTGAICSFRAAKALATNPGSRSQIETFHWHNSVPFEWNAQQLMDLGLMEPGQWF